MAVCTECHHECDVDFEDNRFDAHSPGGVATYGSVDPVSVCCGADVEDFDAPEYEDDLFDDDFDEYDDDVSNTEFGGVDLPDSPY